MLNKRVTPSDKHSRLTRFYLPYHLELGRIANAVDPRLIISIHSFTNNYEGEERDFEMGVLSTTEDSLANKWAKVGPTPALPTAHPSCTLAFAAANNSLCSRRVFVPVQHDMRSSARFSLFSTRRGRRALRTRAFLRV
jgi:hypothetical protein